MNNQQPSKTKTITIFIITIIVGFILFILPNLFFGITKINGGLKGINLFFMAIFQLVSVFGLIRYSLKLLNKEFRFIGWTKEHFKIDAMLGLSVGVAWTAIQFLWLIPMTGGAERPDIQNMLSTMDGTMIGLFSFIALGVIGGGITEEIYNRGYFITVLESLFENKKVGIWIAAFLSILFFTLGHLPHDVLSWLDILVPTIAYTLLFIYTKRLTAPIFAHGIYNLLAIIVTYQMY